MITTTERFLANMINAHVPHDTESNIAVATHTKQSGYLQGALDVLPPDNHEFRHVFGVRRPGMDKQGPAHCSYVSESNQGAITVHLEVRA